MNQKINNSADKSKADRKVGFEDIITSSKEMLELIATARKVSQSSATVLITGESGVGKELIAQAIHNNSLRKEGPFVAINCAGMPDTLLESELFGHEKGAFTDAISRKKGKFELANGGTLFLDEIGDLSPAAQAKTLRAIEQKSFERVGGEETITVDCRIISATNKDLSRELKRGRFREDLYYRLHEIHLGIPALRERKEDIPLLIDHFIKEFNREYQKNIKGVSNVTLAYLMKHNWPGNVRELKSVIKGGMSLVSRDVIWLEDLPFRVEIIGTQFDSSPQDFSLESAQKERILKVLNYTEWNKAKAASLLKISRPTLDKKIREYGLKEKSPVKT